MMLMSEMFNASAKNSLAHYRTHGRTWGSVAT